LIGFCNHRNEHNLGNGRAQTLNGDQAIKRSASLILNEMRRKEPKPGEQVGCPNGSAGGATENSRGRASFARPRLFSPRLSGLLPRAGDLGRIRFSQYLRVSGVAVACFFCWVAVAVGQDVQVRATVGSDVVDVQDQFQYTITISGADSGDAEAPRLRFADFQVVSGPNVSTSFQWINGRTSSSKSITYILLPRREGQFTLEPAEITIRGKVFRTQAIKIRVTANSSHAPPPRPPRSYDPFGFGDPRPEGESISASDVTVSAVLDKPSVYQGEQVTLTYHLSTRVGVSGLQLQESPSLNGFWVEDLEVESNPVPARKMIGGEEFLDYVVRRQALFPTTAGRLSIPPATFAISIPMRGDLFRVFTSSETIYRKNRETSIEVKPLPAQGRPPGFGNAVGSFNLKSSTDKSKAATGEAISLKVRLEGRGNLKMIPDVALPNLPDFTVFSSKRAENVRPFENATIGGDKTWDYVIVPKAPGDQSVPPVTFSYFDPAKEKYETLSTPEIPISVIRGVDSSQSALSGIARQDLQRQGTDINFIKLSGQDLRPGGKPYYTKIWFLLLAALPVALNVMLFLVQRERSRQSVDLRKLRRARGVARGALKQALKSGAKEPRKFYDGAAVALSRYLSDRFQVPEIAVTGDTLERTLSDRGISPEIVREAISCLQDCDFGRFVSSSPEKMRSTADRITRAIEGMERAS
jgi:hypothetical protein